MRDRKHDKIQIYVVTHHRERRTEPEEPMLRRGPKKKLVRFGAQVEKVGEPLWLGSLVFNFQMDAYPEAKSLNSNELRALHSNLKSWPKVANLIGASQAFAYQNAKASE